jgi:hypothetical protein
LPDPAAVIQTLPGFRSSVREAMQASGPIQSRLRAATRPAMVQVAPGKYLRSPNTGAEQQADGVTLARWSANGDGTYSPLPYTEPMVRVDARLIHLLGFRGQWHTLARLARAGFIEMIRIAPGTTMLNLNSYFNHLARCAEDAEFWDKGKGNFEEYRKAL